MEHDVTEQIIEVFRAASVNTLVERLGITISEASAHRVVGTMPVTGNTQPYGLLHGGASCALAETLGSLGAAIHAGADRYAVGIEISATHHRAASAGLVTGVATLLYGGRTIATYDVTISDDRGRRVCTSRLTCVLSERVPRSPATSQADGHDRTGEQGRANEQDHAGEQDHADGQDRANGQDPIHEQDRANG